MTYGPTSLTKRLAEIAAHEQQLVAEGYCVFALTKDEGHWNAFGVRTAADLDAYLDAEDAKERRKAAYCRDDDEEWLAEMEREEAEERRVAALTATAPATAFDRLCNSYQPGWA